MKLFFPDILFGWCFFTLLMLFLVLAAVIDVRTAKIPKPLTIALAACGVIMNVIRGAWLGSLSRETWQFGAGPAWLGAIDGFCFALVGLLFAFAIYMLMWTMGVCGGGDVKLCAAIGAWLGGSNVLLFLFASVVAHFVWAVFYLIFFGLSPINQDQKKVRSKQVKSVGLLKRRNTFSMSAALAAAMVMLWVFRVELRIQELVVSGHGISYASITPTKL